MKIIALSWLSLFIAQTLVKALKTIKESKFGIHALLKIWKPKLVTLSRKRIYKKSTRKIFYLNNNSIYDEYVKESIIFVIRDIWDSYCITPPCLIVEERGYRFFLTFFKWGVNIKWHEEFWKYSLKIRGSLINMVGYTFALRLILKILVYLVFTSSNLI